MCRNITLVAAVNSLIQSGLCVAFGVVAILMFNCKLTPTPIPIADFTTVPSPLVAFTNTFYLQYFHSKNNCIAQNDEYWKNVNDSQTGVVTKSYQVHGIFIAYVVENSLWLVCTSLLFFGCLIKSKWVYVTYQTTTFTVIIYDIILIVLFSLDFKSYKTFQGNSNVPWITKETMLVNIIVMLLIVSRFVIFFIVNVIFSCLVQGHINAYKSQPKRATNSKNTRGRNTPPTNQIRNQTEPYHLPQEHYPSHHDQSFQQEQFNNSPYRPASRYPDVVSHPASYESSPAMRYGSPTERPPMIVYQDHRQYQVSRQAPPSSRMSSQSHESLQQQSRNRMNNEPPRQRTSRQLDYDSPPPSVHEGPHNNYTRQTSQEHFSYPPVPPHQDPRRQNASASNLPASSVQQRNKRLSSDGSTNEELKNQRPWSYINPGELPSSPNKLNQFYVNRNAQNERVTSNRGLPSVNEDEPVGRQQQRQKREYNRQRHSIESREPLLKQSSGRAPIQHVYANLEPPVKKNVRFSQRTHSLDYLETSFPFESPPEQMRFLKPASKPPKNDNKNQQNKQRHSKDWSSSGEELCTDEFLIVYGNKPPVAPVNAAKPRKKVSLERTPSSASSPNLIFDPVSNSVRLVFKDKTAPVKPQKPCRRKGATVIHAQGCDGHSCRKVNLNETSL